MPEKTLRITVLGSGTSSGVPAIGCDCEVCTSANPKNKRRRSGLYIQQGGTSVLVDTSPDLRDAALTFQIRELDAVLYTHEHADHIYGCDDLRSFGYMNGGQNIPAYAHPRAVKKLRSVFDYFDNPMQKGGGVPKVDFKELTEPVQIGAIMAEPIPIYHGKLEVYGFRIGPFAYLNDTNRVPESSMERLQGLDVLLIDALRHRPHSTHFTVAEALEVVQALAPKKAYLVHIAHDLDHAETNATLPSGVEMSYDGLVIEISKNGIRAGEFPFL